MKRLALLLVIISLALPSMVAAQDLTETYNDGQIGFRYPAGWYTSPSETDISVTLSNAPIDESRNDLFSVQTGVVTLTIGFWGEEFSDQFVVVPTDLRFRIGYVAGLMSGVLGIVSSFGGTTATVSTGELQQTKIGDQEVYSVELETSYQDGVTMLLALFENGAVFSATAPSAEFGQWRDVAWSIAETVQLAEVAG